MITSSSPADNLVANDHLQSITHLIVDEATLEHLHAQPSTHRPEWLARCAIMVIGDEMSDTLWKDLSDGTVHIFLRRLFAPDTLAGIVITWLMGSASHTGQHDKRAHRVLDTMTTLMFEHMASLDIMCVPPRPPTSPWLCSSVHYEGDDEEGLITLGTSRPVLVKLTEHMTGSPPFQSNSCELLLDELVSSLGNLFAEHEARETSWPLTPPIFTTGAPHSLPSHALCYELGVLSGEFYVEHLRLQHIASIHDVA